MSESDPPEDDLEMLAAEYALGLLTRAQLPHVAAWRQGSARFDQAVQLWEMRLLPLADALAPVEPSPGVWAAIAKAIAPRPAVARSGFWDSLKFWRGFSLASVALCAMLAAAFLLHSPAPLSPAIATATLASTSQGIFVATAEATAAGTRLVISPSQVIIPKDKSAELWLITPGKAAAAVGLLASDHAVSFTLPTAEFGGDIRSAELAVSIEPPGGSPTGQHTGPIIAAAKFLSL